MTIEPSNILAREDMEKERTPAELSLWWEEKNREFEKSKEGRQYVLLKKGLAGKFLDEIYPFTLLANILFPDRSNIGCVPNLGNDNFDAIIRDYSYLPPTELKIEFTLAIDGYDDHLRMKYFIEHGWVSQIGPLSYTGTEKTGHNINVECDIVSHAELLANNFALIKSRAEAKCKPIKYYGKDHILVIVIDDYLAPRYDDSQDIDALNGFIETNVINLSLDFGQLYVVGLSGKAHLQFKLDT